MFSQNEFKKEEKELIQLKWIYQWLVCYVMYEKVESTVAIDL